MNDFYTVSRSNDTVVDIGLRSFMLRIYNYMAAGLAITGSVAFLVSISPNLAYILFATPVKWLVMFAPFMLSFVLSARIQRMHTFTAQILFWTYSVLMGLSMSSIMFVYTESSIARAFFVSSISFLASSIYGQLTKKDLSGMGSFLFMGVIGILVASLFQLFFPSNALQFIVSVIGVVVFTGLTAHDTQMMKTVYYRSNGAVNCVKMAIIGALQLYINFINIFISLLNLFGEKKN